MSDTNSPGRTAESSGSAATKWQTKPARIELAKHGGGFVEIELIPPATLSIASASRPKRTDTRVACTLRVTSTNLPQKKLPCRVQWVYSRDHAEHVVEGEPATLDVPAGQVEAALDLMSAGPEIGPLLASGGSVTIVLTPDYPHVEPGRTTTRLERMLALRIGAEPPLRPFGAPGEGWPIGTALLAELSRGAWDGPARLRVDTPDDDATVEWSKGEDGEKRWQLGCNHGALVLPHASKQQLAFDLYLEVASEKGVWAPVHKETLTVAQPHLGAFTVRRGAGLAALAGLEGRSTLDPTDIRAHGRLSGFAPGFDPPFALELWVLIPGRDKKAGCMHPVFPTRVPIGPLHADGSFEVVLDQVTELEAALGYFTVTPFAVLRTSSTGLVAVEPFLAARSGPRCFSDEDFATEKGTAYGLCSKEIKKDTRAARDPVLQKVSASVVGEGIRLHCSVLGPEAYWKAAKPSFAVHFVEQGAIELKASYEGEKDRAQGGLVATLPFKSLGAKAGMPARVEVVLGDPKARPVLTDGAGVLELPAIRPELGPIRTFIDKDPKSEKERVHFVCPARWFPKASKELAVTLLVGGKPFAGKWSLEHAVKGKAGTGTIDDEGLEFFAEDPTQVVELLASGALTVQVARPPGTEKLYDNPFLEVAPCTALVPMTSTAASP